MPAQWLKDPVVWLGALFGAGATAYAVFADRYLPYIDWGAHLGLISVLAHGGSTGALDFFARSFAPSPYLLFYLLAAIIGQIVAVDVAAKVVLCLTGGMLALGASSLAEATGRSPRLGLIGPLAMFGLSMGWGFGSFVLATPIFFFALAAAERTIRAASEASSLREAIWARSVLAFAIWLALLFLAHGFLFFIALGMIGVRALVHAAADLFARRGVHATSRPLVALFIAGLPGVLLMVPSAIFLMGTPSIEAGTDENAQLIELHPLSKHLETLGGDLLERGSDAHWTVMYWTVALFAAWLVWSLFRAHRGRGWAMEIYALLLVLLFLFGPMTVSWPSSIWLIYPRFGVIAALAVLLLPRADLRGVIGLPLALAALILVGANASLNAQHIREFGQEAHLYDPVRAAIPPGQRVLALTVPGPGDPQLFHHASGALYSYLMVDGASYVAFLFDKNELPVHLRRDRPPLRAPIWTAPALFDPRTHGVDYDYLVLRGTPLVQRVKTAGLHELVAEKNGWAIFKTKQPAPRMPASRTPG